MKLFWDDLHSHDENDEMKFVRKWKHIENAKNSNIKPTKDIRAYNQKPKNKNTIKSSTKGVIKKN